MHDQLIKTKAFKLKGRLFTFTVLQLLHSELDLYRDQLREMQAQAPRLFEGSPIVIDCSQLTNLDMDFTQLCQILREYGLLPVALQGGSPWITTLAQSHGLAVLKASATHDKAITADQLASETLEDASAKSKIYTTLVRSGQQVVCKGGDLTITASVSPGAEVLADGNIHVYGALKGRALAGLSGNEEARIFCYALEAELIAIAGFYRLSDTIEPMAKPCQIFLKQGHIHVEVL